MKSYNFENDKTVLILENYQEILSIKSALYTAKAANTKYLSQNSDANVQEIIKEDLRSIENIENTLESGKTCNKEIAEYIQKQCEEYNIDTMSFIHTCIKSYMQMCDIANQFPRKNKKRK